MIVVDLGCAEQGGERSIETLLERFQPTAFFGFDPHRSVEEIDEGIIRIERKAAWTYDGKIWYLPAGLRSRVGVGSERVPCFDLARWLGDLPDDEIVVKMDVEGAEAQLLEHLIETGTDRLISLLLIEWHDRRDFVESFDRQSLTARLRCPVEVWH
jgi:hypothetical protein